jgi:phosphoribosylanthranilate isomerase
VRVKICGIKRLEDALLAEYLEAWAVGFIAVAGTKRYILPEAVREITSRLGPFITKVGVFMDTPPGQVISWMRTAGLQVAQLHGQEPPEWAEAIRKEYPVIKAFKLAGPADPAWLAYPCDALMVDGVEPGSGRGYPLEWIKPLLGSRLIVAGGLTPDNVAKATAYQPYAIDVSSGVESSPGLKDPQKLRAFLELSR